MSRLFLSESSSAWPLRAPGHRITGQSPPRRKPAAQSRRRTGCRIPDWPRAIAGSLAAERMEHVDGRRTLGRFEANLGRNFIAAF